jgi:hypothetical protein
VVRRRGYGRFRASSRFGVWLSPQGRRNGDDVDRTGFLEAFFEERRCDGDLVDRADGQVWNLGRVPVERRWVGVEQSDNLVDSCTSFAATGTTNVPANASAVVLNVTGTGADSNGLVTIWPCDQPQPTASNLNLTAAATSPNLVIAKITTAGTVCLYTHTARPAQMQESYFQLAATASFNGMLYADPDETTDPNGIMFWNATNSCCDLFHRGVDDSAYIASIIADVKSTVAVDPKRIFVVGHSNAGFMAYRMACNHAGDIAAIVSLAGATYRPATSNLWTCVG